MMRIFVASAAELLTDHRGHGEGLIAWNLLVRLAARGHDVVACANDVDLETSPPFEVVAVTSKSRVTALAGLAYGRAVRGELERRGGAPAFDVGHWMFPQQPEFAQIPNDLPFVVGPLSLPWPLDATSRHLSAKGRLSAALTGPPLRFRHRRMLKRSHLLAAVPEVLATMGQSERARGRLLPFGIDPGRFEVTPLPQRPTVLYLGRLSAEKRVEELVHAFARVPRRLGARMLVAGDGPEYDRIKNVFLEHRLGDRAQLLGALHPAEVPQFLARGTVLASAAVGEPFGMTSLEGMAAGRPLIGIDIGGPRYLIDHGSGGHRVKPGDLDGLALALTTVLSDRILATEMGRYNRRRVEEEFCYDRVIPQLEAAYMRALRSRAKRC
jgi:glycosyltransferase involved in cell wall biosynthesis